MVAFSLSLAVPRAIVAVEDAIQIEADLLAARAVRSVIMLVLLLLGGSLGMAQTTLL